MPVSDPAVISMDAQTPMRTCAPLLPSAAGFGKRKPVWPSTEKAGRTHG